ncbi:MAG: PAS domain-containing protein [Ignavibacteria bacterium]|nr:PAS domain-containing protein [Ignavibacteria bacterium]
MEYHQMATAEAFAADLSMPVFLVDRNGDLLYYNSEAGQVLGREFDETGGMPAAVWGRIFNPTAEDGTPLAPEALPLMIALSEGKPATGSIWISGIDNERRHIVIAAFPIRDDSGKVRGAMAVFWEKD